jgi:hypothetical protein
MDKVHTTRSTIQYEVGRAIMHPINKEKYLVNEVSQKIEMPFWKQKEFWVFSPIYFFLSFIELTMKLRQQMPPVYWKAGR